MHRHGVSVCDVYSNLMTGQENGKYIAFISLLICVALASVLSSPGQHVVKLLVSNIHMNLCACAPRNARAPAPTLPIDLSTCAHARMRLGLGHIWLKRE